MTLAPGTKLGPYEILERIGAGGMGEVWKARDTRLGRIVAIKTVKEQHSERFKQEARSIAALNHANICQIFDIGPDYLVLEYVEGKPLAGPLPENDAVRLAIQIASALEEAHQHGIIHRDLKPSNILVTDKGSVKLLDFGLAKLYEQDAPTSQSPTVDYPATQAGAVLGTVAYMSPEQAQGRPADARSDIFSFGLVLYEILSGKRAFSGDSNYSVMDAIVKKDPPPLQISPALTAILRRCLAKQPSVRYQTMTEIKAALEQVLAGKPTTTAAESQPSIAVLPFVNMSGDKEQEYFSAGLAEEIINALTQIPGLRVIARTSSFAFRGKDQDIRQIAEALSVTSILEGSVRRAGNRVRITAQLIRAVDGSHLWSQRYDREMTDVFAIQDEIAQSIAEKLRVRLAGGRPLVKHYTENVEVHTLCLKGRYLALKGTEESLAKSTQCYEQAIVIDPNCALAWFGLADSHFLMGNTGWMSPKTANAQCRQAVLKALKCDETLPLAHCMMGSLCASEYDWKTAEREFLRAIELGSEEWTVWVQYSAYYLVPLGRLDEAVEVMQRSVVLDPLAPILQIQLAVRCTLIGQYGRAIEQCGKVLDLDPHFGLAHLWLGIAYIQGGMLENGIRALRHAIDLLGQAHYLVATLGLAYAKAGQIDKTRKLLSQLRESAQTSYTPAIHFAVIHFGLGETDKSMDWLEKAVDEQDSYNLFHYIHSVFSPLRSHPRFRALLRGMHLESWQ